uniref:Piwi domain-containing protein n=1 Tax=Panagrolaimus sp. JU765 TaxID=591449 RepID=A0AC34Q166_9BILA
MMSSQRGSRFTNQNQANSHNNYGSRYRQNAEYQRSTTPQSQYGSQNDVEKGRKESFLSDSTYPSPPGSCTSNAPSFKPWETFPRSDYPLEIKNLMAYHYHVGIHYESKTCIDKSKKKLTTEKTSPIGRQLCYYIIKEFTKINQNFGNNKIKIVYDNLHTLLSNVEFDDINGTMLKKDLPDEIKRYFPEDAAITVEIQKHRYMPKINLDDLNQYKPEKILLFEDRTVLRSLEIIVFQGLINSGKYFVVNGKLYQKTGAEAKPGYCTKINVCKGIRMLKLETTDSNGNQIKKWKPALIVNCQKALFYAPGKFSDLVSHFLENCSGDVKKGYHEAEDAFRGLKLLSLGKPNVILQFVKFTSTSDGLKIKDDKTGETIKMSPVVMCKCNDNNDYPLESLEVLPNQYIETISIYNDIDQATIETVHGNVLADLKEMVFNNKILKAYGIIFLTEITQKLSRQPLYLEFSHFEIPQMMLGNNQRIFAQDHGSFFIGLNSGPQYNHPATVKDWVILCPNDVKSDKQMDKLIENLKNLGIVDEPNKKNCPGFWFKKFERLYKRFQEAEISYVLVIDKKNTPRSRGILNLMESLYKIPTQQIPLEIFKNLYDKNFTLSKILHEFNVKNGGINYIPNFSNMPRNMDLNTGNVFVIAYGKPEKIDETENLSIVGFSANFGENPWKFIDDYFYQENQEMVNLEELEVRTQNMLKMIKDQRGMMPKIIAVFRYGFPAHDFGRIFTKEISAIENGCKNFDKNYNPKFVTSVTSDCSYNLQTDKFVDEKVIPMKYLKRYMTYDKTTNNTAKFVNNYVFRNDSNKFDARLFLYSLCYGHQVQATSTFYRTALPMPIHNVGEMTKKGAKVYETLKKVQRGHVLRIDGKIDYIGLSNLLG